MVGQVYNFVHKFNILHSISTLHIIFWTKIYHFLKMVETQVSWLPFWSKCWILGRELWITSFIYDSLSCNTAKPAKNSHSKIDKTNILMTNVSLMKVKSIAECSTWSILQFFWPALSNNWSWKPIFCLFESGRFTQILLYTVKNSTSIHVNVDFHCLESGFVQLAATGCSHNILYFHCLFEGKMSLVHLNGDNHIQN